MTMNSMKAALAALAGAAILAGASAASATTVFSSSFQGATFTVTQNSLNDITFEIVGADALTGDWAGAQYLGAFSFKGLGGSPATANLVGTSNSQASQAGGLNAGGCNGSGSGFICFDFSPNIAVGHDLKFDITGNFADLSAAGADLPHLKIDWTNSSTSDAKIGSLYSEDIPLSTTPPGGVPEPATWGMMLVGFSGLGAMLRRRRRTLAAA